MYLLFVGLREALTNGTRENTGAETAACADRVAVTPTAVSCLLCTGRYRATCVCTSTYLPTLYTCPLAPRRNRTPAPTDGSPKQNVQQRTCRECSRHSTESQENPS